MCEKNFFLKLIDIVQHEENEEVGYLIYAYIHTAYLYNLPPFITDTALLILSEDHLSSINLIDIYLSLPKTEKTNLLPDFKFAHDQIMEVVLGISFIE